MIPDSLPCMYATYYDVEDEGGRSERRVHREMHSKKKHELPKVPLETDNTNNDVYT